MKTIIKLALFQIFVIALSNWIVNYHFDIKGFIISYASFTFPLVVVATDLTIRVLGKETGRKVVSLAFLPAILISMYIVHLSGAPNEIAFRIGLGSGCSYIVSSLMDITIFQKLRENFRQWWVAPTFSSIFTMYIDTFTFYFIAFYNNVGSEYKDNWVQVATNHATIKVIICLLVVLPIYGVVLNYIQNKILKIN